MAQAGATLRYRWRGSPPSAWSRWSSKIRAHLRLLRALRQDFRAGRYDLVILVDYPGFHLRVAEAARASGHQGAVLHRAPALGLAAGAGRGGWRPRWTGWRSSCRSSRRSSADSGSAASTWAIRWWTGRRWPTRRGRARELGIPTGEQGTWHVSREPSPGDPAVVGAVPRRRASACSRKAVATGCSSPGPRGASIPIPGAVRDRARRPRCGSWPQPTRRWPSRARRRSRRRWPDTPMVVRVQGPPAHLAMLPAGAHGASGSAW